MDPVSAAETFTCEKYHCTLTRKACADRQVSRSLHGVHNVPTYPGCQECEQGKRETQGLEGIIKFNHRKHQEVKMAFQKKIDDEKLRVMIAAGKFADEIAAEFGVNAQSVRNRAIYLGLTIERRRYPKGERPEISRVPGKVGVRQIIAKKPDLTYTHDQNTDHRIIPITLRLTVEVNVRVSAEGVNAA